MPQPLSSNDSPSAALEHEESVATLWHIVSDALSRPHAIDTPILLAYYRIGDNDAEIARVLGKSKGYINACRNRALRRLRHPRVKARILMECGLSR